MAKSLRGEPCAFPECSEPSGRGEHINTVALNQWMKKNYRGPFTAVEDRKTIHRRDNGPAWESKDPITHKLPCCPEHNQELSQRFEQRFEKIVDFLEGREYDEEYVGLWHLKTALLLVHPEAVDTASPRESLQLEPLSTEHDLYSWMVTGDDPPSQLRLFCHRPSQAPLPSRLELTRFGGHLILDGSPGKGGPDGSSIEVSAGVPA